MIKIFSLLVISASCLATLAEPRGRQNNFLNTVNVETLVAKNHPYLFLSIPYGDSRAAVRGFEIIEATPDADDDHVDDNEKQQILALHDDADGDGDDDDIHHLSMEEVFHNENTRKNDDDDDEDEGGVVDNEDDEMMLPKPQSQKMFRRQSQLLSNLKDNEHSGSIMIPDQIMEIEVQTVYDRKTGKTSLILPRKTLDSIPDDSVVALLEKSSANYDDDDDNYNDDDDDDALKEEARANRVIVRRRRKGAKRNVRRRVVGNRRPNIRRRVGGRRPGRVVYRRGGNVRFVRGRPQNIRRNRRPIYLQG